MGHWPMACARWLLPVLIARLAIFEGLRPGEILALRLDGLADDAIWVKERVYKRVLNTPKTGKARKGNLRWKARTDQGLGRSCPGPLSERICFSVGEAPHSPLPRKSLAALHAAEAGGGRARLG